MKSVTNAFPLDRLLERLPENYTHADRELVQRAYRVAEEAQREQKRYSGEPFINHCLAVASILADLRVPPEVVAAGLLHDTVEDTTVTLNDIRLDFGDTIATLVDGVTKLTNLPRVSRDDQHAENPNGSDTRHSSNGNGHNNNGSTPLGHKQDLVSETLRKTFLAMGDDVRVVLIKLADRLHNMRTLGFMPEHKRNRIAKETLDIFAPLANRLGIWQIKWELEDLGFRYANPEKYKEIAEQLQERSADREAQIESIKSNLLQLLSHNNVKAEISGRPRHIYSIYKKMSQKDKPFEMIRDARAVRIIVQDVASCYTALGVIHTHWRPIPGEFDDYIAAPKDNFYQSLHTAVIYDDKRPLEVQIRTPEMHQNAEYGIAAHWRYKERSHRDKNYEQRINWLRNMMEWRSDVSDAREFVDGMKSDVFQDRVYLFTPRGDIIDLAAGSTPIDFAYHVHTDIGHRCRGARVNGKLVPLVSELKTGDMVEILTAKRGGPSRDWLNPNLGLVKTQRARSKIKAWFKKQEDEQNLIQGRAILERELQKLSISSVNFEKMARELGFRVPEEMFILLGIGDLSVDKIIRQLFETVETADVPEVASSAQVRRSSTDVIEVVGLKGLLSTLAHCCNPISGDEIVGYITRGRGVTIHRKDCTHILLLENKERLMEVGWGKVEQTFPVHIIVKAHERQGLIGDISTLLQNKGVNIADVSVHFNRAIADVKLVVEVSSIDQLSRILSQIENIPSVLKAYRGTSD